ncbi:low temperature requirement protein A [Rhizobium oryzicola]|uniref:Low temperature requirement protein A n=1 Tax=Rhizobium oryzicola TaxID=1232668 RepID=A0ABT8T1F4_9HYPH|nr:low temperature requirement protein A [Rhizobium oryzicola]MDO1584580.1 low temperature requirement protein A [Rhizobium oryzicola]
MAEAKNEDAGQQGASQDAWLRDDQEERTVGFPELFFDLVFVFALIQLSHFAAEDFTYIGLLEAGVIALALWWVWIHTAWVTNWLDPEHMPIRVLLFGLMFLGLLMASAIPEAFEHKGLIFAGSYCFMQIGRSLFAVYAFKGLLPAVQRNFIRVTLWFCLSGLFWIGGALAGEEMRIGLWIAALAIEFVAPELRFRVPGFGRSSSDDWDISGDHMAERCALFVMICLGEAILAIGRSFSEQDLSLPVVSIFAGSFLAASAMWWIYFHFGHERASEEIEETDEPGEVALYVFTYAHIPVVAGIILTAVAAEHLLAHAQEPGSLQLAIVIVGGPLLFLAGNFWVKRATTHTFPLLHALGLAVLAGLGIVAASTVTAWVAAGVLLVLLGVAAGEYRRLSQTPGEGRKRGNADTELG